MRKTSYINWRENISFKNIQLNYRVSHKNLYLVLPNKVNNVSIIFCWTLCKPFPERFLALIMYFRKITFFATPVIWKLNWENHFHSGSVQLTWSGRGDASWVGAWQSLKYCLLNFIPPGRCVMRDNDNCGWRQGWRVTSAGVREGDTVAARPWLHCFKWSETQGNKISYILMWK